MARIIITEITRFSNPDIVCSAGINMADGTCIRPIPYLSANRCRELNLVPGVVMSAAFSPAPDADSPHIEDANYRDLRYHGPCASETFRSVLEASAFRTIEEGFSVVLERPEKYLSRESAPSCSLVTLKVDPNAIQLVRDEYDPRKIKAHISDASSKQYRYLTVTDLGLNDLVMRTNASEQACRRMEAVLHDQHEVFVRIGLSRHYAAPNGKSGFWLQVNGIYSFPNFFHEARTYRNAL